MPTSVWSTAFTSYSPQCSESKRALIILNQSFSRSLFNRIWSSSDWRSCADGGANRVFDTMEPEQRGAYLPDLVTGDFDSIREEVKEYYAAKGVRVVEDHDQDSTDLMKCVASLEEKERLEGQGQYDIVVLGGLSGRLDHTIHTLAYLHKLRKTRKRVFAITDESMGWVLDTGEHEIEVNHAHLGPTCGILPVGVDTVILSTKGLRWNLTDTPSSFDGLVSTSNQFLPDAETVWIKTSGPVWWTAEVRRLT